MAPKTDTISASQRDVVKLRLQLVHMGEAMYLMKINGSSDGDDLGVLLLASKVTDNETISIESKSDMRSSASGIMELPKSHFHNERSNDSASIWSRVERGGGAEKVDGTSSNSTSDSTMFTPRRPQKTSILHATSLIIHFILNMWWLIMWVFQ